MQFYLMFYYTNKVTLFETKLNLLTILKFIINNVTVLVRL